MGTSLTRKQPPLGPYRRPMPRVLGGSLGGGRFLMGEEPLYFLGPTHLPSESMTPHPTPDTLYATPYTPHSTPYMREEVSRRSSTSLAEAALTQSAPAAGLASGCPADIYGAGATFMCLMRSRSIMRSPFICRAACVSADFGRSSRSVGFCRVEKQVRLLGQFGGAPGLDWQLAKAPAHAAGWLVDTHAMDQKPQPSCWRTRPAPRCLDGPA